MVITGGVPTGITLRRARTPCLALRLGQVLLPDGPTRGVVTELLHGSAPSRGS